MTDVTVIETTQGITITVEDNTGHAVTIEATPTIDVEIATTGLQGPAGPQGPPGPAAGEGIVYEQATPAASWPITHGLGRPVGIVIRLASGEIVNTSVDQSDLNVAVLTFPAPESGKALVI